MEFVRFGHLGFGGQGFSPSQLPDLKLWTRYNQGITVTGSGVSQWDDQSGNGNHLKQATDTNRPLPGTDGSDVVVNGDFSTDTDWTGAAVWSIAAGVAHCDGGSGNYDCDGGNTSLLTVGVQYLAVFTISSYVGGNVRVRVGSGGDGTARLANGTYSEIITATTSGQILFTSSSFEGDIDNLTCQPLTTSDGILFDGIDNFLKADAFTLAQPETVYILGKQVAFTSGDVFFDGNTSNTGSLSQVTPSPNIRIHAGTSVATNTELTVGAYSAVAVVFDGASSLLQVDSGSPTTGNAGANNMGGFTLGAIGSTAGSWSNIQVKEVIVTSTDHDLATRAQVISYLNTL